MKPGKIANRSQFWFSAGTLAVVLVATAALVLFPQPDPEATVIFVSFIGINFINPLLILPSLWAGRTAQRGWDIFPLVGVVVLANVGLVTTILPNRAGTFLLVTVAIPALICASIAGIVTSRSRAG